MVRSIRRILSLALFAAIILGSATTGIAASQLRFAITQQEGTLNPYTYVTGYPGHNLLHMVYDGLMQIDREGIPQPWLAKSVDVTEGGKVWTMKLHENAKWHDGKPLTADDVRFTYEYVVTEAGTHSRWSSPSRAIEKIDTPDDHTVIFTLKAPNPSFNIRPLADVPIMPRHIWTGVTAPKEFMDSVGSGPYKVAEYVADKFYRLEANPDYFLGKPAVDTIFLEIISDANAMFTALRAGQVDAASRALQPELVAQFESVSSLKMVQGPSFTSSIVLFNTEREPYSHKEFRQAVDFAVSKERLVETVLLGQATVATGGFVHPDIAWANPDLKPQHDPAKAQQLLDQLGMKDQNNDGYRQMPDGTALDIALLAQSNNPLRIRAAELIAADLKAVGIKATVKTMESTSLTDLVWKDFDVSQGRNFDMAMFGWSAPVQADVGRLRDLIHSDTSKGALNLGAYKNPAADALGDQLATQTDPVKRYDLSRQLQAIVAEDVPVMTLWFPLDTHAYNPTTYDGWVYTKGQGILSKISFFASQKAEAPTPKEEPKVEPKAPEPAAEQETTATRSSGLVWFLVAAGLAVVALVLFRRKGAAK